MCFCHQAVQAWYKPRAVDALWLESRSASHWPCVTDFSGLSTYAPIRPKRETSTPPTLLMGYGTPLPFSRSFFLTIMQKHDVIHKPEVHNVSQRQQRRSYTGPEVSCSEINSTKFGRAVSEICVPTCRQTQYHNTSLTHTCGVVQKNWPLHAAASNSLVLRISGPNCPI